MANEPTAAEIKAYIDAGHTQIEAAQRFRISRWQVQRILNRVVEEDGPGPTEAVARILVRDVGEWDELEPMQKGRAEALIGFAVLADIGRRRNANGAERNAAVAALKEFERMVAESGQASGAEELIEALRRA